MKLRFKHQKFQEDATNATCDVFAGQPNSSRQFQIDQGDSNQTTALDIFSTGWANAEIHLREDDLLKNLRGVQKQYGILPSRTIETLTSKVQWEDGRKQTVTKPVFTVEMETGTGKTYTYIKTMYEMNARYGWSKFIIVVPSVAIREGVLKSFQITADHFKEEYGKACRYFVYNSTRLNELEQFADDSGINVMIINTQAFNATGKDARRIAMKLDSFRSRRPIDVIASVNPIVIVDEPQSVLGTESKKNVTRDALGRFNPLYYLTYSATHRENFNMVYRLDAVDAYQKQLVKKITVKGISIHGTTATNGYLYLQRINVFPNKSPSATVIFEYNSTSSSGIGKKVKTFTHGDNIYDHSGEIEAYRNGYTVSDINARDGYVEFTNGIKIGLGQVIGDSSEDDIRRIQIRETIMSHLEKERELYKKGIKVLSLFFIDEVKKYRYYDEAGTARDGDYAKVFEEEYKNAIDIFFSQLPFGEDADYRAYLERDDPSQIHGGYFSQDKKGRVVDSEVKRGESESADVGAYDLIMKNKERLLSHEEPVRFIFSHSALREGWDNPNVFQICTLRTSTGEIKKRQEIGRGLRLSVNKDGERMDADVLGTHAVHDINALTVIANESYEEFAKALQDEFYEVIKNRPKEITPDLFTGQVWVDGAGNETTIDSSKAAQIFVALQMTGLVSEGQLSEGFHDLTSELRNEKIAEVLGKIDASLTPYTENVLQLVESVYDPKKNPIVSDARAKATLNINHEKFASREFKTLWENINSKTYYTVSFSEDSLIQSCIRSLNKNLRVSQTLVVINQGYLDSTKQNSPEMKKLIGTQVALEEVAARGVTFDLLGEIAMPTKLTRESVAKILAGVEPAVFKLFSVNPEEFIREAIKLIDEQKASTIIEHITYDKLDEQWNAEEIFIDTTIAGEYGQNVVDAKRHLYDKLKYDSTVEKELAAELDTQDIVELYVKLPSGFYINTPMGKYNPDWAISFKEGSVKHIYFVAETKGDTSDLQLREVEKAKIECARRHFSVISSDTVKYSAVSSYSELLTLVNK